MDRKPPKPLVTADYLTLGRAVRLRKNDRALRMSYIDPLKILYSLSNVRWDIFKCPPV